MEQADEAIAPILGLPRLPVLQSSEPAVEDDYFGLHWKTRAIVNWAAGRAFAWVDDEITESDREWIEDRHAAPALLLRVDARRGLTVQDLDTVEAWLRTTAGDAPLTASRPSSAGGAHAHSRR
jgi:hypothetical protein